MKILHVSAAVKWGGGENHLVTLCHELKNQVENTIFCVAESMLHRRLQAENVRVIPARLSNQLDLRFVMKLITLCKREKFDVLHIHDSTALTLCVIADHFTNLPSFIFSKKTTFPIRIRRQTLYKYQYPKLKTILCVSEATREVTAAVLQKSDHLEVIYHGTSFENKHIKSPLSITSKYNLPANAIIIGNIANHIEAKNLETFIRTAHYLTSQKGQKNLYFIQIGSFTRRTPHLQELVKELKLEDRIIFTGYVPEASALLPQFYTLLMTSENEGIPQVIYEAFYHGVPVISTEVGGISEIIEHKKNGLLCAPYEFEALGENLLFLLDNPQVIPTFAKISKEKLHQYYTSAIMAQQTLEQYKKLIHGS